MPSRKCFQRVKSPSVTSIDYRHGKGGCAERKKNIPNPDEALRLMKHLASASNQDECDKAFEVLAASEYWKNEKLRSYFEAVWLSVKELWVMSYRLEFDVVLTTNNGIEAQNRVLKAQYVKSASGKRSLTTLITAVLHGYLFDKEVKFHEAARRQSSVYRQYSENIPAYLHNRPHGFVKHMLRRLVNAEEYNHTDMKELPIEAMFSVPSERSDDDVYTACGCYGSWDSSPLSVGVAQTYNRGT